MDFSTCFKITIPLPFLSSTSHVACNCLLHNGKYPRLSNPRLKQVYNIFKVDLLQRKQDKMRSYNEQFCLLPTLIGCLILQNPIMCNEKDR